MHSVFQWFFDWNQCLKKSENRVLSYSLKLVGMLTLVESLRGYPTIVYLPYHCPDIWLQDTQTTTTTEMSVICTNPLFRQHLFESLMYCIQQSKIRFLQCGYSKISQYESHKWCVLQWETGGRGVGVHKLLDGLSFQATIYHKQAKHPSKTCFIVIILYSRIFFLQCNTVQAKYKT